MATGVPVKLLGQSGVRLTLGEAVVYIDPYLTDYVADTEGDPELRRLVPAPFAPRDVRDASLVLVSHVHMDHCDPTTLLPLCQASPNAKVLCPREAAAVLHKAGLDARRITVMSDEPFTWGQGLTVTPVPAAHTQIERDDAGSLRYLGYVLEHGGRRYYHAGDTSVAQGMIDALRRIGPVDVAFLPVNECNFYRFRRNIVGNMSLRDAFQLAADIGAKRLVPIHWDMFAPNRVYREEIELLYGLMRPPFELAVQPSEV